MASAFSPLKSVEARIVAEGLLQARASQTIKRDFVTSLAVLGYNACFADLCLVGSFTRPNPDN